MAYGKYFRLSLSALLLIFGATGLSHAQSNRKTQKVLIQTSKPYTRVTDAIKARGGTITWEYKYVDGIAAEIPEDAIDDIRGLVGTTSLEKDVNVPRPTSVDSRVSRLQLGDVVTAQTTPGVGVTPANLASFASSNPGAYSLNNSGTRIEKLHALGLTGQGMIIALIDSGIRPGFKLMPSSSIIGGEDLVDDGKAGSKGDSTTDWTKNSNDGHGTVIAGLIAGNATFGVSGILQSALSQYAPANVLVDGKLPLIGTAPDAKLYIVRVFGNDADAGAPKSTIVAAIDAVIKKKADGMNIGVANLSFGISTIAAGRSILDVAVDALLDANIVPVVSNGNTGPATLTTGSPGSSMSAVTVGGLSRAVNERILQEIIEKSTPKTYYPGVGGDIRPYDGTEIAYFSSRGPNADGRPDPDVVANGVGSIGQGYCPGQSDTADACFKQLSIVNGTSFSSPIVTGIAAALRQAFPNATATKIRNAIVASGRADQIAGHFDAQDRGKGLADAWGAYQLLASGNVSGSLPNVHPNALVQRNIEQNTNLEVKSGYFSKTFTSLKPGERGEILYDVPQGTERVIVKVSNVEMNGPQNEFFGGDALYLYIHSAKTSAISGVGDYLAGADGNAIFIGGEEQTTFDVLDPDTGIMRIVANPDTLNAGRVNVHVSVEAIHEAWPHATITDTISDGKTKKYTVNIPINTTQVDFLLTWDHDWAHYPTNDIDLIVCDPSITTVAACKALGIKDGATLAGPERVSVAGPAQGNWMILVSGFNVSTGSDNFKVRITR